MLAKIRTLPPLVSPSEVCRMLWIILFPDESNLFVRRLRGSGLNLLKCNAIGLSSCTPAIVQRALMLAHTCVHGPDSRVAATHVILQENISNKIGLILSFPLIVIWGARMPVVSRLERRDRVRSSVKCCSRCALAELQASMRSREVALRRR